MTGPLGPLPNTVRKLGPGTLTFGEVGTLHDVSCLVNGVTLTPSKDAEDPVVKLCGRTRAGDVTYTWALSGNMDLDIADQAGFLHLTVTAPGTQLPFTFIPAADGPTISGEVTIDPLPIGGDEGGKLITADFEFDVVGDPVFTWGP